MCFSRFTRPPVAMLLALLAGIFFTPTALRAQDSSSMTGVVTDVSGAIVPGVIVTLSNKLKGTTATQTTDKLGTYRFANVAPDQGYTVTFSRKGFSIVKVDDITLSVGITRTQDAKLAAGSTQEVEVSAANQEVTLNTTDATIGNNVDVNQLQDLPVLDRTAGITTLYLLQPGVESNTGAVTGARVDQSETILDGMDVNDIATGNTFSINGNAPVDSVQQFTGTVAGMVSAVGTGSGGQFQLVTKSGTNKFHGNINEYHRDTTTEANLYFNNFAGVPRTPLIRNQFGGNIGGPILKNKLFFFFNFTDSRIIQSAAVDTTVPLNNTLYPSITGSTPMLNYINNGAGCTDASRINTTANCISSLSPTQVAALDPSGAGFNQPLLAFIAGRYPLGNEPGEGDGVNTEGFRFTTPEPTFETNYVARADYNLTPNNKIFVRFTHDNNSGIETAPRFKGDSPNAAPFSVIDYGYVGSDVWAIGKNKVNQFYYGDTVDNESFPVALASVPTGINVYTFTGGLGDPYLNPSSQFRRTPVPEVRDDFNWQVKNHSLTFGGTFKFTKFDSNLVSNFNTVGAGQAGGVLAGGLTSSGNEPSLRPANILNDAGTAITDYDSTFPSTLGVIGEISTDFNYTNTQAEVAPGAGANRSYRYYESEFYVGDTWKVTSKLTLSYGLRYQLYSVPYETHGDQTAEYLTGLSARQSTLATYNQFRAAQIAAGNESATSLPFFNAELGGKANHGPAFYDQTNKDFAPRFAFSYSLNPKTVFNGGAGVVYDRTVIDSVDFLENQLSPLFANQNNDTPGTGGDAFNAIATNPRLGSSPGSATNPALATGLGFNSALIPSPLPVAVPFTPFVVNGIPGGLAAIGEGYFINPNLKDPYSIAINAGVQRQLPYNMVLKVNYAARLGRRLLASVDANQAMDFPDNTGKSTQSLGQAFAGLTAQLRAGTLVGNLVAEPWFEDVLPANTFGLSNTQEVAELIGQLGNRGDIGSSLITLAQFGILPFNVGMPTQYALNNALTNQGNSSYNSLLLTLDKNASHGLSFELNYTWSHSIDNTSLSANGEALQTAGVGFICDTTQPRACRGSSDFDVRQETSGYFVYDLPYGHGRQFGGASPTWLNETLGGWSVSGVPGYRTGLAYGVFSDAFLASADNNDPAIFSGNKADLKTHVNVSNNTVFSYAGGQAGATKALNDFVGPEGFEYGQRNLFNGAGAFTLDAGLAKTFPIIPSKNVNLKFRADAFNALNHPTFAAPGNNGAPLGIVGNAEFGQITSTTSSFGGQLARVAQFSLRLEF